MGVRTCTCAEPVWRNDGTGEMKRKARAVIIIGGGDLAANTVKWAKESGLAVIVTDRSPNAPGLADADVAAFIAGDHVEAQMAFALNMMDEFDIAGVYCANDFGVLSVCAVSLALGLPANPLAATIRALDKELMKKRLAATGLSTPKAIPVRNLLAAREAVDDVGLPAIIKPVDSSGSRGITTVFEKAELEQAYLRASAVSATRRSVLVEEFVEGRAIDVNGLFVDGEFYGCGVLEKFFTPLPYRLPICGYDPAPLPRSEWGEIYSTLEAACRRLGIRVGPVKGDLVLAEDGIQILEVTPRFHGDVTTSNTLPYATGINPVKAYFAFLADGPLNRGLLTPQKENVACWRVICLRPGTVRRISGATAASKIPGVTKIYLRVNEGSSVGGYRSTDEIPGYVCVTGPDVAATEEIFGHVFNVMQFEVEPLDTTEGKVSHDATIRGIEEGGWNPAHFGACQ